jgi:peptide/nickel transport system permease protein
VISKTVAMPLNIDLHTHSFFSGDGISSPEDLIAAARAKGLSERTVVYKHVLKNGLIPVVTILGLQLGVLLAGAIITEKIFGWPGIGLLLVEDGINKRDYRVVQGCVLVISVTYILANLVTDTVYRWLDPRIRVG